MPQYPFIVRPDPYNGRNAQKRFVYQRECEAGRMLSDYLNARFIAGVIQTIYYHQIEADTGLDRELVASLLIDHGGGSNGIKIGSWPDAEETAG